MNVTRPQARFVSSVRCLSDALAPVKEHGHENKACHKRRHSARFKTYHKTDVSVYRVLLFLFQHFSSAEIVFNAVH